MSRHHVNMSKALLIALKRAADFIKDQDGGDPDDITGWKSDEYLKEWLALRAVIEAAEAGQ